MILKANIRWAEDEYKLGPKGPIWTIKVEHEGVIKVFSTTSDRVFNQAKVASIYCLSCLIDYYLSNQGNRFITDIKSV